MRRIVLVGLFSLFAVSVYPAAPEACAQKDAAQVQPQQECFPRERYWRMSVMPYLWASSMKGTITAQGIPSKVDVSFGDIFDALDYAMIGQIELARGRCFILADTLLTKTTVAASTDEKSLGKLGLVDIQGKATVNLETLMWFQELLAGYRVYEKELCGCCDGPRHFSFDLLGGIRYNEVDVKLNATAEVTAVGPGGGAITEKKSANVSKDEIWIDPIIGARMQYDLTHRLALILKGDVGGFGVGSDFAWSATALARYQMSRHWSLLGGYKVLDVDYSKGKAGMDAQLAGPVAAMEYKVEF
jgi:hypothetical protein